MILRFKSKAKLAAVAAVAAFALGGAGVVLAAAATPSTPSPHAATTPHPSSTNGSSTSAGNAFEQGLQTQIATCKAARPATGGKQGIGQCIKPYILSSNPGHSGGHGAPSNTTGATHSGR